MTTTLNNKKTRWLKLCPNGDRVSLANNGKTTFLKFAGIFHTMKKIVRNFMLLRKKNIQIVLHLCMVKCK